MYVYMYLWHRIKWELRTRSISSDKAMSNMKELCAVCGAKLNLQPPCPRWMPAMRRKIHILYINTTYAIQLLLLQIVPPPLPLLLLLSLIITSSHMETWTTANHSRFLRRNERVDFPHRHLRGTYYEVVYTYRLSFKYIHTYTYLQHLQHLHMQKAGIM